MWHPRETCLKMPTALGEMGKPDRTMSTGKGEKHSRSMDEAISSPQGLVGKSFEDWLTPIPHPIKAWLTKKGISFTELLES
jgi:hypothetical protein